MLGTLGVIQLPVVSFAPLKYLEHLGPMNVSVFIIQILYVSQLRR